MDIRNVAESNPNPPTEVVDRLRERLPIELVEQLNLPVPEAAETPHQDDLLSRSPTPPMNREALRELKFSTLCATQMTLVRVLQY